MEFIDLTQPLINDIKVFPQDPLFSLKSVYTHEKDDFSLSLLETGLHAGTHLDAPFHFDPQGRKVDKIGLNELIGPAKIMTVKNKIIDRDYFKNHLKSADSNKIIIIQTGWDEKWGSDEYFKQNPYLTLDAAELLIEKGIKGLGIDGPSVDPFGEIDIHKKLLSHDMWIVENLTNLEKIKNPEFEINIVPLPLNSEASPVRAFLKSE